MLEALVSSRIRRALFEHLVVHPEERFYLRGLAKQLGLSVSPLRRELKRLEQSGMLRVIQEGSMLFYAVNPDAPAFLQLRRFSQQAKAPSPIGHAEPGASSSMLEALARSPEPEPSPPPPRAIPVGVLSARSSWWWQGPLNGPVLMVATAVGLTVMVMVAGLFYLGLSNHQLASQTSRVLKTQKAEVTVVVPPASSSGGTMRSHRWQVIPGGFGGFSPSSSQESY